MADSSAVTTLKEIVYSAMNLLDEDNTQYYRYYQISLDLLRQFNLLHICGTNVIELEMDDNHRLAMPDDCLLITDIGIPRDGKLWSLTRRDDIYKGQSIKNGVLSTDSDTTDAVILNAVPEEGYNATGGKNSYYYTFDYINRKIIISGTPKVTITVYYKSSGISLTRTTYIPFGASLALQQAIIYQSKVNDRTQTEVYIRRLKGEMDRQVKIMRKTMRPLTIDEIKDVWYSSLHQTIRR